MPGIERWVMGVLLSLIALLGLFMASRAQDEIYSATGIVLFIFGVVFVFGLIGRGPKDPDEASGTEAR